MTATAIDRLTVTALSALDAQDVARRAWERDGFRMGAVLEVRPNLHRPDNGRYVVTAKVELHHTSPGEPGGTTGPTPASPTDPLHTAEWIPGRVAVVHPGRPVTMGPAVCQGCGSLVWWSGALWSERDGAWHRCAS